ncbi:17296_t:CDS:2, partial [Racocetra fulgida]
KLCRNHLASCENFKTSYSNEEVTEILSCAVSEDIKRNKNHQDGNFLLHIATPIILEESDNSDINDNQEVNKESETLNKNSNNYENEPNTKEDEE